MTVTGRYAVTPLAPSTETGTAVLCTGCGALVADTAAHDKFHALLAEAAGQAPRAPRGETRRKT